MKPQKHHRITSLVCLLLLVSLLSSCSLFHSHTYRYESGERTHWQVCTGCGEKTPEEQHSLTTTDAVEASCDHTSYANYTCSVCGYSRTDVIPALNHQFVNNAESGNRVCSSCGLEEPMLVELPASARYGYRYLASLASGEQYLRIYQKIATAIGEHRDRVVIEEKLSREELATIFHCCVTDHPEYFWIGSEYNTAYTSSGLIKEVQLYNLITGSALEQATTAFNRAVDDILAGVSVSMSDVEKELYLHDAVVKHAVYDVTYSASMNHSAYGNLVLGTSVCDGYTKLLQYLLCRCGILTTTLSGYSGENHSWNVVCLDGEWYMVDPTWDDPVGQEVGKSIHTYFNCPWTVFSQDHAFFTPEGEAIENYFAVPDCTANKYNYFTYYGYEGDLTLNTIDRVIRAQVARGATDEFEIRFTGHGNTAKEKEATISTYVREEANQIYSIIGSALRKSQFAINLSFSVSKDGNILKITVA